MLDETFGIEATKRFIYAIAESKAWGTCVSTKEISDILLDATMSPISRKLKAFDILWLIIINGYKFIIDSK